VNTIKGFIRSFRRRWRNERYLRSAAAHTDAFLVSYPKSGRTWLRYLLSCYFAETAHLGFEPDLTSTFSVLPNFDRDPVRGIGAFVGRQRRHLPLILVSHLPFDKRLFQSRPIIFLVRDPRDVFVSAYFHATRHKHSFSGDIGAFMDEPTYGMPALINFLNGWAEGLAARRHIILSYERMLAAPEVEVGKLINFLGMKPEPIALGKAIAKASFDRMQAKEREQGIPGHEYDRNDGQSMRMRSGKAKAYSETLSPEQSRQIVERCRKGLTPLAQALLAHADFDIRPTAPNKLELAVA